MRRRPTYYCHQHPCRAAARRRAQKHRIAPLSQSRSGGRCLNALFHRKGLACQHLLGHEEIPRFNDDTVPQHHVCRLQQDDVADNKVLGRNAMHRPGAAIRIITSGLSNCRSSSAPAPDPACSAMLFGPYFASLWRTSIRTKPPAPEPSRVSSSPAGIDYQVSASMTNGRTPAAGGAAGNRPVSDFLSPRVEPPLFPDRPSGRSGS